MKRRIIALMLAAILVVVLFGCGNNSSIKGTKWEFTGAEYQGMNLSKEQMNTFGTLEFSENNVVNMYYDYDQNGMGQYTVDDNKVTIMDYNTGEEMTGTIDGKKMTFEYQGIKLFFEKE
ncbi:MAG: hypothetical protein Q4G58_14325 [bacterium]|nr:hypothetical protein [bacterium]